MTKEVIKQEYIFTDMELNTKEEALHAIAEKAVELGLCRDCLLYTSELSPVRGERTGGRGRLSAGGARLPGRELKVVNFSPVYF